MYRKDISTLCISSIIFFLITSVSYGITVTNLNDSGSGSLRDAIANTAPGGTVDFGVSGTITLLSELVIDKDLIIDGPGADRVVLSGGGTTRIIVVNNGTDLKISGLRFTNGNGAGSIFSGLGDAILLASNSLNTEISDCVFDHNTNTGNLALGVITNLAVDMSLTINRCVFRDNTANTTDGLVSGVVLGTGGSQYTMVVNDSTFESNEGHVTTGLALGGVIGLSAADLDFTFNNCTFSSNVVTGNELVLGGVIGDGAGVNVKFTNCTFYNNRAECAGNDCQAGGGAIGSGGGSNISCDFCTFDSNEATCSGANCQELGDTITASTGLIEISNSIIKGDDPSNNCGNFFGSGITSLGYNIDNGSSCIDGSVTGDKPDTDPLLDPAGLQDNGGFAETVALQPGSPAIDMADPACPPPNTDERGVERPQLTACDIGAYELIVQVSNIPTMSEWGLIITAGLLGISGFMVIRRRKAAA